jgi:hypothetical protein
MPLSWNDNGRKVFKTETERVAFLIERHKKLAAPLELAQKKPSVSKRGSGRSRKSS